MSLGVIGNEKLLYVLLERRLARDLKLNTFYGALFYTNSYKNHNKVSKGL